MRRQVNPEDFIQQFFSLLPEDLRQHKADVEKNVKAALQATFSRMDLVTREEFEIQSALLARSREMLDDLQEKVDQLEQKLQQK